MPNIILQQEESPFIFTSSDNDTNSLFPSGATFIDFDVSSSTAQGLVVSAICDLGPAPRTSLFEWRARVSFGTTKSADADVEFYLATSDGRYGDGGFGSGKTPPANFNPDNLLSLGIASQITSSPVAQVSGRTRITSRFVNVVAFLPSSSGAWDTATDSYVMLTPVPTEVESG
jgi:hypothetical protein